MKIAGSLALKLCFGLVAIAAVAVPATGATLSASPSAVSFAYTSGEPQPVPVTVIVTASDGSSPVITVTLTPPAGAAATLFVPSAPAGDTFQVGYDVNTLQNLLSQPGVYTASVTVGAAGFTPLVVPLTFSIGGPLSVFSSAASLIFNIPGPSVQTFQVSGSGNAAVSFSLATSTLGGGNWLSATASASYTPATITVTVNSLNVPTGTYSGGITITAESGPPLTIPVTLQVGANTLSASPAALEFAYMAGGTIPPTQVVQLSSTLSNDTYTAQAVSTGNWLLVNGVTAQISGALPASLNVTVNPAGLAVGTYQGAINASDAVGNTQTVTVTLVVGSISNVANPTSLVFVAQVDGPAPATQFVLVNGFGSATYTATANGAWLSISSTGGPAPAELTVSANPAGLAAGTYAGNVVINLDTHIQNVEVTFIVSASPVLTATPGAFNVSYFGGSAPPSPVALEVGTTGPSAQSFTIAPGVPSWLQVTPIGSTQNTPASLTVTLTPQILPSGTYLADIILTPAGAGGDTLLVPVLLTVDSATAVVPSVTSLSFTAAAGGAPQSRTVEVTAASAIAFTAAASTTNGGNWLSVSPPSGTASATGTALTVTADASNLTAGTYQGTVELVATGGVTSQIAVTLTVAGGVGPLTISPSTLAFAYTQDGPLPAAQILQIAGSQSFTASTGTSSGGTWLTVSPPSGTGNVNLSVSVNPADLPAGVYNGSITITPATTPAQIVPVTLTVSGPATLAATPNPLAFAYSAGNPPPAAQTVTVTATGAVAFTATAASSGWLSVTQSGATTPATLSVSVNPSTLGAGSYNGAIALTGSSGTLELTIGVSLTIVTPLPVIGGVVNAAGFQTGGIAPGELITIFGTSLGPVVGVGAAIDKGFIETTLANVTVTFNGYPGPILYASAGQINLIVPYELAGASNVSVEAIFGSARSNSVTLPVLPSAPGIFSADSSGQGPGAILDVNYNLVSASNPVSPGAAIQIFATGQGQTSPSGVDGLIEPLSLPLPYPLLPVEVTIGGVSADILYVGAAPGLVAGALQVNVVVPDGVTPGTAGATPLFVIIGGNSSQPGITVAIN